MSADLPTAGLPSVGFIGVGNQGGPMAARIQAAGFPLTLWARRPEVLDAYPGAARAPDLAALAAACEIIGICVFDDEAVNQVYDGLEPDLRGDTVLMIHATVHPDTCRALAGRAARKGVRLIDAPVSGGGDSAARGRLTVMCGGDEAVIARCRPVIDSFAALVVRLGDVGAGQEAKLINNALMTANMGVADAAVALARAIGVDVAALNQVIAAGSGRSFGHDIYAKLPSLKAFERGAKLLRKDADLLAALARGHDEGGLLLNAADAFLRKAEGQ